MIPPKENPYIDPKLKNVWEQGYAAACQQKDEEIESLKDTLSSSESIADGLEKQIRIKDEQIAALKEVLRFADCPELIIENPTFIIGKKPTDEDMEWARGKAKEYLAKEESKDEEIARLRKSLEAVIEQNRTGNCYSRFINDIATEALKPVKLQIGDRVKRKKVNAFKYHRDMIGTIVEITADGRNKIKWDEINTTGQQHSTIQTKFLDKQ